MVPSRPRCHYYPGAVSLQLPGTFLAFGAPFHMSFFYTCGLHSTHQTPETNATIKAGIDCMVSPGTTGVVPINAAPSLDDGWLAAVQILQDSSDSAVFLLAALAPLLRQRNTRYHHHPGISHQLAKQCMSSCSQHLLLAVLLTRATRRARRRASRTDRVSLQSSVLLPADKPAVACQAPLRGY